MNELTQNIKDPKQKELIEKLFENQKKVLKEIEEGKRDGKSLSEICLEPFGKIFENISINIEEIKS
jgi:type II secretory pathway component PulF